MWAIATVLALGFVLGMRHATDPDHVVAVTTIVSRERSWRAAAPVGALWGIGHSVTIFLVGGAMVALGLVMPPRLGLGLELCVALMLVALGVANVGYALSRRRSTPAKNAVAEEPGPSRWLLRASRLRPVAIGLVHGLAGSAAIALLVLSTIQSPLWGFAYLLVFSLGTVAGMLLVTTLVAFPVAFAAQRFASIHTKIVFAAAAGSVALGLFLVYDIGFTHGLFTGHVSFSPG